MGSCCSTSGRIEGALSPSLFLRRTLSPPLKQSTQTETAQTEPLHSSSVRPQTFSRPATRRVIHSLFHNASSIRSVEPAQASSRRHSQSPCAQANTLSLEEANPRRSPTILQEKKKASNTIQKSLLSSSPAEIFFLSHQDLIFFSGTSSRPLSSRSSFQRLTREMSTAKVSEALSMVQIIACVVASSFFLPPTLTGTQRRPCLTLPGHAGLADPPLQVRTINWNHPTELWNQRTS